MSTVLFNSGISVDEGADDLERKSSVPLKSGVLAAEVYRINSVMN